MDSTRDTRQRQRTFVPVPAKPLIPCILNFSTSSVWSASMEVYLACRIPPGPETCDRASPALRMFLSREGANLRAPTNMKYIITREARAFCTQPSDAKCLKIIVSLSLQLTIPTLYEHMCIHFVEAEGVGSSQTQWKA